VRARRIVAVAMTLLAVGLASAGCRESASNTTGGPSGGGASELSQIQTTLDAIDSEVAGDDSP
jgi:hypothetical protein